jgi:xylose isomerase
MAEAFAGIGRIKYEGPGSKSMLAFRRYDPDALVEGKPMREHLRFAVSYWHAFRGTGSDPFGPGTMIRPWEKSGDPLQAALARVDVAFEFLEKLGCDYYCFHDRDVAPDGATLAESNQHFDTVADRLLQQQQRTGKKLLWGTANLFSNPRYVHGAATSPNV